MRNPGRDRRRGPVVEDDDYSAPYDEDTAYASEASGQNAYGDGAYDDDAYDADDELLGAEASPPTGREGVTDAFLARAANRSGTMVDPLDLRSRGADPDAVADRVVFRLWSDGLVSGRAIEQARRESDGRMRLDQRLVALGLVDEDTAAEALAVEVQAPAAHDEDFPDTPVLLDLLPRRFVEEALALPLDDHDGVLTIAIADPIDDYALRAVAMKTRRKLEALVASPGRLREEIARIYDGVAAAPARREAPAQPRPAQPRPTQPRPAPAPRPAMRRTTPEPAAAAALAPAMTLDTGDLYTQSASAPELDTDRPALVRRAAAGGALGGATPRFVRPKRVTRKAWTTPDRAASDRRFVGGFVDGLGAADAAMDDFGSDWLTADTPEPAPPPLAPSPRRQAPVARQAAAPQPIRAPRPPQPTPSKPTAPMARRPEPAPSVATAPPLQPEPPRRPLSRAADRASGGAARRAALAETRRALRSQAAFSDHGPTDAARQENSVGLRKYQAARALAERDAVDGDLAAVSADLGSLVRHRLIGDRALSPLRRGSAPSGLGDGAAPSPALGAALDGVATARTSSGGARPDRALGGRASGLAPIAGMRAEDIAPDAAEALASAIAVGDGLILVCGPAGAEKLPTAEALATQAAKTLRAPKPYRFDRDQSETDARPQGRRVAFGSARDPDGAEAAVRFAMKGGLAIVAVDASAATAGPERLIQLGVPAYALAASLRLAVTQRRAEVACGRCAQTGRAVGGGDCPECGGAGTSGRPAVTEAVGFDDTLRALVLARAPEAALRHALDAPRPSPSAPRRRRNRRAAERIASAATAGAYGFGAP